ncbi:hypothetical protein SM124_22250 [Bacillus sp. 31A1R]|uniref:Uncharacterized protein n=1 Tax=Robertmurraya mangrovi TaxID=3098077 RepID=A0ABU5J4S1_9BACI|nr:hypothetical protein [Bacillus sp. 31A1R]MDZ5474420.1 hypothetical protein [Bacillus sp. 31A1R]
MMNSIRNVKTLVFISMILLSCFLTYLTPVSANVDEVESQHQRITETKTSDFEDIDPKDKEESILDKLKNWGKDLINEIKIKVIDIKDKVIDEWNEFTEWAKKKWKDVEQWTVDAWEGVKEFFSQEWVQTVLKIIGAIVVVAAIVLAGVWVLAAIGITLTIGMVLGAVAFGAIGVLFTAIGGDTSFIGLVTGGLSSAIASLVGLGALRVLNIFKLLPASGPLRFLTLGLLGGSGAVSFSILHGALYYLFTGDNTKLKEAFALESLLLNFTLGGIMGPLAARIFSQVGLQQTIKGPGKWIAGLLAKHTRKPVNQIAQSIVLGIYSKQVQYLVA